MAHGISYSNRLLAIFFSCNSVQYKDSGWRVYDENAIFHIRIINLLRQLDIPIRDIKTVLERKTYACLSDVVKKQISALRICNKENASKECRLLQFLSVFESENKNTIVDSCFLKFFTEMEEDTMKNTLSTNNSLQFITLPPMRVVYNVVVSVAPEDEAMSPVLEWLEEAGITGTARLFGGNMPPMPSKSGKPYGYGMCASIPEGIPVPKYLKEMNLPGGIYARLESTNNISVSWKKLLELLSEDENTFPIVRDYVLKSIYGRTVMDS